jgi:very-short-patch-repair endonuclease
MPEGLMRGRVQLARQLRRTSADAETLFWRKVRARGLAGAKFRRQRPIGGFVVDFACLEARLVVEIDGGQHNESTTDGARTERLNACGYRVIRFWNNDVLTNIKGVMEAVLQALRSSPHPSLSPGGEREKKARKTPLPREGEREE